MRRPPTYQILAALVGLAGLAVVVPYSYAAVALMFDPSWTWLKGFGPGILLIEATGALLGGAAWLLASAWPLSRDSAIRFGLPGLVAGVAGLSSLWHFQGIFLHGAAAGACLVIAPWIWLTGRRRSA